ISISSKHMLSLIQDILDVTRSQYKPLELSYSFFNTKEAIEEIIKSFNNENLHYTIINYNICADYTRFKQLVYNLISNAIKFNKKNMPINILTYTEADNFCFEITDNGEGILEENYNKIFDFFSQVSKDSLKRQMGYGIGLSLCKSIAESHNGNINVSSDIGKGSTFIFKLPIDKE
ncbi:MAG: HAMP domain-containing histidine kinase, partial [Candidatus Gastranaerophilales bacterium]|nr:HAMP domain-containing histidine kinase [Candidatus Gastranaerophilales bacterium]